MTRTLFLVAVLMLVIVGCGGPGDSERCDDLEKWFEGVERELSRECAVDTDCAVVYVRPDHPIAASQTPDPVGLDRARDEFASTCGSFGTVSGSLVAVCEPIMRDEVGADGIEIEVEIGRTCALRGTFEVETDADAGSDVGADVDEPPPCACASDAECPDGRCVACACYPDTLCGDACAGAASCDAVDALGVGASASACVLGCEAAIERTAEYTTWATCLASASCDEIEACAAALP